MNRLRTLRLLWLLLAGIAFLLLASCGDDGATEPEPADQTTEPVDQATEPEPVDQTTEPVDQATEPEPADQTTEPEPADADASEGGEASEDSANEERSLVIYAPWNEQRADFVTDAAAEELGIDVKFLIGGGGELTDRLIAEKENSQADIVLGIGESQMNRIAREGIFEPYLPEWSDKVPAAYIDPQNRFTLYSQVPVVVSYNAGVMNPADAPTSWLDLADAAYEGKFVLPGLGGQTGQATVAGILWRFADPTTGEVSDEGWEVLRDIYSNEIPLGEGERTDLNWIATGEMPIYITWRGGVAFADADNDSFELTVIDTEGGTPFVSTGIGITADTGSPTVARQFVDWFGSADFQIRFVDATNNDPPANEDAIPELPTANEWLSQVSRQDIDWLVVSSVLDGWLERIELDIIQ